MLFQITADWNWWSLSYLLVEGREACVYCHGQNFRDWCVGYSTITWPSVCRYHREFVSLNSTGRVHLLLLQALVEMEEVDKMAGEYCTSLSLYYKKNPNFQRIPSWSYLYYRIAALFNISTERLICYLFMNGYKELVFLCKEMDTRNLLRST